MPKGLHTAFQKLVEDKKSAFGEDRRTIQNIEIASRQTKLRGSSAHGFFIIPRENSNFCLSESLSVGK